MAYDDDLADRVRGALSDVDDVVEKRMFGGLAFMVSGHMAVGVSGQGGLMVRCDPAQTDTLVEEAGVGPFEMRGKSLNGWLRVDATETDADRELQRWVQVGVDYVGTLPPK